MYKNNQNQILSLLGLKTTDGQPETIGAINGILQQEDAFNTANEKVLQMQDQAKADAIQHQKDIDALNLTITNLETKQQQDLSALAVQQQQEIAAVKNPMHKSRHGNCYQRDQAADSELYSTNIEFLYIIKINKESLCKP